MFRDRLQVEFICQGFLIGETSREGEEPAPRLCSRRAPGGGKARQPACLEWSEQGDRMIGRKGKGRGRRSYRLSEMEAVEGFCIE